VAWDGANWPDVFDGTSSAETITSSDIKNAICKPIAILSTNNTSDRTYWFTGVSLKAGVWWHHARKVCSVYRAQRRGRIECDCWQSRLLRNRGLPASTMSRNILQGLIGAWCPSLGPSGYTLLDRSGRGNHGQLQNMDAGSDWVGTAGGWASDFDGTNDYVSLPSFSIANELTISAWFYARSTSQAILFNKQPTNTAFNFLIL
jgi:hypothetical protein